WTIDSQEYQHATEYLRTRTYQRAVDKLEGLVVQQLLNSHWGHEQIFSYKLRMHISKALKAQSKAIQWALASYNEAALALNPLHLKLTWAQIVEYSTIAEFELLHMGAHKDIQNLDWANVWNREATVCHLKILQAQEETVRLNVETKWLATWIIDEPLQFNAAITRSAHRDPRLAAAITQVAEEHRRVNTNLQVRLHQVYALVGFTGDSGTGAKEGDGHGAECAPMFSTDEDEQGSDDDDNLMLDGVFEGVGRLALE
ncbi:hypothetical protein K439DRAFT_1368306, partial [Ramaria rubella]